MKNFFHTDHLNTNLDTLKGVTWDIQLKCITGHSCSHPTKTCKMHSGWLCSKVYLECIPLHSTGKNLTLLISLSYFDLNFDLAEWARAVKKEVNTTCRHHLFWSSHTLHSNGRLLGSSKTDLESPAVIPNIYISYINTRKGVINNQPLFIVQSHV